MFESLCLEVLQRTTEPLLRSDQAWEGFCVNWATVLHDGERWHMWYEAYDLKYQNDNDGYLCYATSEDGEHWAKPDLGLIEYEGSKHNNIVIDGPSIGGFHGEVIFHDPEAPPAERFKIVFTTMRDAGFSFEQRDRSWEVRGGTSPDGRRWTLLNEPLLHHMSDTQNVCFHDNGKYRMYVRMWRNDGRGDGDKRRRTIGYTESATFGNFPPPREIFAADEQDPARMDFYNSAVAKLRDGLYIMFPSAFLFDPDTTAPHVAASRDGVRFERVRRTPILPLGTGFDSECLYVCPGVIRGPKADTYWVYYMGHDVKHGLCVPHHKQKIGGIGRALIQIRPPT